ncbi:MAG TPA: hypothetical protein PLG50_10120 [bacterium]|nr:hypothetical protein [bacterium]HQG46005.1 hypothetical protein [bacterium]HQI47362.1 hypothetical protein [bacterium]HQJ63036.1 hypothetical protein [bacterium]
MGDICVVLLGQTIACTCYVLAILALMAWFSWKVTRQGSTAVEPGLFYAFVGLLVVIGVSLHILIHETIPWKTMDLNRAEIKADREYVIHVVDHRFVLPSGKLVIKIDQKARFVVVEGMIIRIFEVS